MRTCRPVKASRRSPLPSSTRAGAERSQTSPRPVRWSTAAGSMRRTSTSSRAPRLRRRSTSGRPCSPPGRGTGVRRWTRAPSSRTPPPTWSSTSSRGQCLRGDGHPAQGGPRHLQGRRHQITFPGQAAHAGWTPMETPAPRRARPARRSSRSTSAGSPRRGQQQQVCTIKLQHPHPRIVTSVRRNLTRPPRAAPSRRDEARRDARQAQEAASGSRPGRTSRSEWRRSRASGILLTKAHQARRTKLCKRFAGTSHS